MEKLIKVNNYTNTNKVIDQLYEWVKGEIKDYELTNAFYEWAEQNNYTLNKRIKFLVNMAYNSADDVVVVVQEDEDHLYYNDSCHRYCYIEKCLDGIEFDYV